MDNEDNECVEVLKRSGLEGKHFEAKGVSRANSSLPTTLSESAIESASIDHGTCNLVKKHTATAIDAACQKALKAGARWLKDIQRLTSNRANKATSSSPRITL
jgi:hypothetical protein